MGSFEVCFVNSVSLVGDITSNKMVEISWGGVRV